MRFSSLVGLAFVTFALGTSACTGPGGGPYQDIVTLPPPAETCSDGVANQDETDVDCGGALCEGCQLGQACGQASDCESDSCTGDVCDTNACANGIQDPSEDGVDCGGTCGACLGASCGADADCATHYCDNGLCATPSCVDGIANGAETGVDCGGGCPGCPDGGPCGDDADCGSGFCEQSVCGQPPATCLDGIANGAESDVDCGGTDCPACGPLSACNAATDCASGLCVGGSCEALATCSDGAKNGTETDEDCGGSACLACPSGKTCLEGSDCLSFECVFGQCITPTCGDGFHNGAETDADCGGPICPDCEVGKLCGEPGDCESDTCEGGVCIPTPSCEDLMFNASETDLDCGGPICDACALDSTCLVDADCLDADCIAGSCQLPTCDDQVTNQDEVGVDCGGALCDPCGTDSICGAPEDCASGVCTGFLCIAETCADGVLNQGELSTDCGGPNCALCDIGAACENSGGCSSGVCHQSTCILDFDPVASADARFCGVATHDGSIICWGQFDETWPTPPAGTDYVSVHMGVTAGSNISAPDKICALDAGGLATCNFQTGLPTDVPFSNVVIGTVEGGFACGMHAEATAQHVVGSIECWGPTGPTNTYPYDLYQSFEVMVAPTHRWQVFAEDSAGILWPQGYDTFYFTIQNGVPWVPGTLTSSRFRVGTVWDGAQGLVAITQSQGASPPINPPAANDVSMVQNNIDGMIPTSLRIGHYDLAIDASTQQVSVWSTFEVPDATVVPTEPVTDLWHGEWHTCTKHGAGTPLTCWGLPGYGDVTPPLQ